MKQKIDWKRFVPHIIAVLLFLTLTLVYFAPVLEGRDVRQADVAGSLGCPRLSRGERRIFILVEFNVLRNAM